MNLKWSQFLFGVESTNGKNEIIIRNTLTGAVLKIEKQVKKSIDDFLQDKDGGISKRIENYINQLTKHSILVPLDMDESEEYCKLFQRARKNSSMFVVHVVTTTNCQLNCPYCYETGIKEKIMNFETADKIILWCSNYLNRNNKCSKFRVIWYGGEPLLNKKVIQYILPQLHRLSKEKNIQFDNQIVTNGVLLNKEIVSFLAWYNLSRIQVTLDGPKRLHDQRRSKKNGEGTFDQIFQNILDSFNSAVVKKISLRLNFDKHNIGSIPELLDLLIKHKLQEKIELSFGIITSTIRNNSQKRMENYLDKYCFNDIENIKSYLWLYKKAKEKGFVMPNEFMLGPWCVARDVHSVIIEPDGSLVKCFSGVGRKEFKFGDIDLTVSSSN